MIDNRRVQTILTDNLYGFAAGQCVSIQIERGRFAGLAPLSSREADEATTQPGVTDLRGRLVLPGLIDAHVHAIPTGYLMLAADVREVNSILELEAAILAEAAKGTEFVRVVGLDRSRLPVSEHSQLNRRWLDELVPKRPLFVKSVEGHSSWFNTAAWNRVGIEDVLTSLEAELAEVMHKTGYVHGNAYEELAGRLYDSFTFEERRQGMLHVLQQAAKVGLTGIHCLEGYGDHRREDFSLILDLDGAGCDLTLYARDADPRLASEMGLKRFGGCWCVDGAIGAHSAAVSEPYADKLDSCGQLYFSDDELREWVSSGLEEGMQVCNHVIGDRAIEQGLRVYESLASRYDLSSSRPRLDHFILGDEQQAQRAASLGICTAMQPAFDALWGGATGGYARRLGPKRALRANPVAMAIKSGMRVAGSSDSYITPLDPLFGMRAAMNHHNPEQRVDFDSAVRMFTEDAAFLAHQEGDRGAIRPGLSADLTVLEGDRSLQQASVHMTIKAGEVTYEAGQQP